MSTSQGYTEGMSREALPHPTNKIQVDVVVQNIRTGTQYKVLHVEPDTRQFTVHGGFRTDWHAFDDFVVLDGQEEPLDANDPDVKINDLKRALAAAEAQKEVNEKIAAREADRTPKRRGVQGSEGAGGGAKPSSVTKER